MMGRFLKRVEGEAARRRTPWRTGRTDRRADVFEDAAGDGNPVTGYDYTDADWFTAGNGYPFYVRAAELIRHLSRCSR